MDQYALGVDLSEFNTVDFNKLKQFDANRTFAILRTSFGGVGAGRADHKFETFYKTAKDKGINVGAYHYSYSVSPNEAFGEAQLCLNCITGKKFEYPIYLDFEDPIQTSLSPETCVDIIYNFCDILESNGWYTGWYTYYYLYKYISHASNFIKLSRFDLWLADWEISQPHIPVNLWQTSDHFSEQPGSIIHMDLDSSFIDYPNLIISKGLNGYSTETVPPTPPTPPIPPKPLVSTPEYAVGIPVCTNILATSSDGGSIYHGEWEGVITKMLSDKPYPYLLNNDTGWTDDFGIDTDSNKPNESTTPTVSPTKYTVGTPVCTNRLSTSSNGGTVYKGEWSGTITKIIAKMTYPYLLNNGMGWTNDTAIDSDPNVPGGGTNPSSTTKYSTGIPICTNTLATSSDGGTVYYGEWKGTITKVIVGKAYPYLVGNGTGWTNDEGIDTDPNTPDGSTASYTTKYNVNLPVCTNTLATSSDGGSIYHGEWKGIITKVIAGKPYPYLIDNGTGWTNDLAIDSDPNKPE